MSRMQAKMADKNDTKLVEAIARQLARDISGDDVTPAVGGRLNWENYKGAARNIVTRFIRR